MAPWDIKYPTDLDLLNRAREISEELIDKLYRPAPGKIKPRSYRRVARKDYLSLAKQRKKSKKKLHRGIGKQLNYLRRNIGTIHRLLDEYSREEFPLSYRELKQLWVIIELYRQQRQMHREGSHRIDDRMVSISQPYVRPIVRGKGGKEVEFGSKISASLIDGCAFVDRLSWDNYNEGVRLKEQVERYRGRFGVYPEVVIGDQIHGNRENRRYLKAKGIRFSGKALGRPVKIANELRKERRRRKRESGFRNRIEGKFGQGKRKYGLGCVKAKTMATSASWVAVSFLVMNLIHGIAIANTFVHYFIRALFGYLQENIKSIFIKMAIVNDLQWNI